MTTTPARATEGPGRLGPRPLALHLGLAMSAGAGALAALPAIRGDAFPWQDSLAGEAERLRGQFRHFEQATLFAATQQAVARRLADMVAGIQAYHDHPYRLDLPAAEVIWQEGSTRLLDYGRLEGQPSDGGIALFVPSLINRYYVLDISAEASLLRWLGKNGIRPLVIDWDAPGEAERQFDLDDYIAGRLVRLLDAVLAQTGRRPALVGYCLGGNLALGLASLRQADLAGLALLATPWDFHAGRDGQGALFQWMEPSLEPLLQAFGQLPVDILQALFAWLDPNLAARKFRRFARLEPASRAARSFVALEDWLNDGVPLARKVARSCLFDWYGRNLPVAGGWSVAGRTVLASPLELPALIAVPSHDRIVPPASSLALIKALPEARLVDPAAGHIGMVVGSGAKAGLWQPLLDWLLALAK